MIYVTEWGSARHPDGLTSEDAGPPFLRGRDAFLDVLFAAMC